MPVSGSTFTRTWQFVDQFQPADYIRRADADIALNDLAAGINAALDAVSEIDVLADGANWLADADYATTAAITLSGDQIVDGATRSDGDRIVARNQADAKQNGLYTYNSAGAWTRTADANTTAKIARARIRVTGGAANALKRFEVVGSPVIGANSIVWDEVAVEATAAATSAAESALSAAEALASKISAAASATTALAGAEASGNILFYDTKAEANAALAGLPDLQVIEVLADESLSGLRTRYRVESAAYVFKLFMKVPVYATVAAFTASTEQPRADGEIVEYGGHRGTVNSTAAAGTYITNAASPTPMRGVPLRDGIGLHIKAFAAVGGGIVDDTAAIVKALNVVRDTTIRLVFDDDTYLFTSQLDFSKCNIVSHGAVLLKGFDGVGVLVDGGPSYTTFHGDLSVNGTGAFATDGSVVSTSATAHGILISGRCRVEGKLLSNFHWGNGFQITCDANMNKCSLEALWGGSNGVYGIRFSGIVDNCSVWKLRTYTQHNYQGGVWIDDDFLGRQWEWYIYNEASQNVAGLAGVYLGQLKSSTIFIYSEEQTLAGGPELHINSACLALKIFDSRNNTTTNEAEDSCVRYYGGAPYYLDNTGGTVDKANFVSLTNDPTKTAVRKILGSSGVSLASEVVRGDGGWKMRAQNRDTATSFHSIGADYAGASVEGHLSTGLALFEIDSHKGTAGTPATLVASDYFSEVRGRLYTGASYTNGWSIKGHALSVGGGNKASTDMVFGVANSSANVTEQMRLKGVTGNLEVGGALIWSPSASETPDDNGEVTVEATSNTTLTFKLKGTDGVVRSGTLTLA